MAHFGGMYIISYVDICVWYFTLPNTQQNLEVNAKVVADVCFDATGTLVATGSVDHTAKA